MMAWTLSDLKYIRQVAIAVVPNLFGVLSIFLINTDDPP